MKKMTEEERAAFDRGYSAGWAANNKYRADMQQLQHALSDPSSALLLACTLTVFGGLFAAANIAQWVRWHQWDFWLIAFAVVPLTISFLLFRGVPKARRLAREESNEFKAKWGDQ